MQRAGTLSVKLTMHNYLLRIWGRDERIVLCRYPPDAIEDRDVACYWFATPQDREEFIDTACRGPMVALDRVDQGDGRDVHAITTAEIVLLTPDGVSHTLDYEFGHGYPISSAEYMWREGNYSCDCNKRLFIARAEQQPEPEDDLECGDSILIQSLIIRQVSHKTRAPKQ